MKQVQPAVVIGLGGTGVSTITFLKKALEEQAPDLKEFVRFLAIDIDELKGELPSADLFGEPIRLDEDKNEFFRITDQTRGSEARNIPAVSSWFPEEGYQFLPLTEGARQIKAIGRLGFFLAHEELARRIHRLTDRLVTSEVKQRFPGLRSGELNIYIVGSICGGTGAGLCIDTAYELRYLQQQAELPTKCRIKGLFALGDVYDAVSKRVLANTYASLREFNWFQREFASYSPDYPDVRRDELRQRAFDSVYLIGSSNIMDIELSSPQEFAQLCADMIFLDSGADAQDDGDSLSQMIQSSRNNTEAFALASDADGTSRCYSSFGLCKIRFPAERVRDLCAARLGAMLLYEYVIGATAPQEILEAKRRAQDFIPSEGLSCDESGTDLPDRLVERQGSGGEREIYVQWVTKSLTRAYNADLEKISDLEIGRINQIVKTLNSELVQLEESLQARVVDELQTFRALLNRTVKSMFKDDRQGVGYVGRFLKELLESARSSREFAQQEMKNLLGHEKRLSDRMNKENSELASLLDAGLFAPFKRNAQREQLKTTYGTIRQYFQNRIGFIRMRAAGDFYDGVFDSRQRLVEGGEGAISILQARTKDLDLIQSYSEKIAKDFKGAYEDNKRIQGSPFEILIYDNEYFSDIEQLMASVATDNLKNALFQDLLGQVGGSVWDIRSFLDNEDQLLQLRGMIMGICRVPFAEEIERKSVAQRVLDARNNPDHPIDYRDNIRTAYELAGYYCRLNGKAKRFATLRDSEQALTVVVGYYEAEDAAWDELKSVLRESTRRSGAEVPFSRSSDRHSILLYREFSGFPAYTLSRINAYHNSFIDEARRENSSPLQMFTREALEHINVPTHPVLSGYDLLAVEALAIGIIDWDEEHYYLLTEDEWKRRKLATEAHARGENASFEDRTAGSDRRLGRTFSEVVSRLSERLPDAQRLSATRVLYRDEVEYQVAERKPKIDRDTLASLYAAMYFDGIEGTQIDNIGLETTIRPPIIFLFKRDFALREDHIRRPKQSHTQLLRAFYLDD
ncbi:tubulin-like doman-containing protein [Candidatus Thiosymbion oneisti]|uniref:tubulin-like doman-containing protein n=1 Tax=Candidatus Thiosymbion oneisti TaxID=589554 RepID=UPI000B801B26|nr:tubulin-like doman-containing protein [Candidatus Thiosymbion oneisti]